MGRVIGVMQKLRDAGNSLVVVEHDPQIMFAADRILDLGPGPGERGGNVVFFGTPEALRSNPESLTGAYLAGRKRAAQGHSRAPAKNGARLEIKGASEHNLKAIDVEFPLQRLVCVTGVSGSGKSTLVQDVLHAALLKAKGKPTETPGAHAAIHGHHRIDAVVLVDQSPIGRTTRSNPASYVGAFDAIPNSTPHCRSRRSAVTRRHLQLQLSTGRCPGCGGNGFEHIEMQFLSDVYLRCPDCNGTRYRSEVLEVKFEDKSIAEALDMTVSEALAFFRGHHEVQRALRPLSDVGLEYLRLGQPVPTLSGGEAQRLKLAGHLAKASAIITQRRPPKQLPRTQTGDVGAQRATGVRPRTSSGPLSTLDAPPHHHCSCSMSDDRTALRRRGQAAACFRSCWRRGHSLIIIEHNLDVIAAADWIIDLGRKEAMRRRSRCAGTHKKSPPHLSSHTASPAASTPRHRHTVPSEARTA